MRTTRGWFIVHTLTGLVVFAGLAGIGEAIGLHVIAKGVELLRWLPWWSYPLALMGVLWIVIGLAETHLLLARLIKSWAAVTAWIGPRLDGRPWIPGGLLVVVGTGLQIYGAWR